MRTWAQSDSSDARAGMGAAAGTPTSSTAQLCEITCTAPMGALRLSPSCRVSAANMCPDTMTCRVGVRRARHNELEETGHTRRTSAATPNKVLQRGMNGTRAGCRAGRTSLSIQPHHAYGVITSGTSSAASGFMSVIFR